MKYVVLACLLLSGCTVGDSQALRLLHQEGVQAPTLGGWPFWGCGQDDTFKREFTGLRRGQLVSGTICCDFFKDCTVRYK